MGSATRISSACGIVSNSGYVVCTIYMFSIGKVRRGYSECGAIPNAGLFRMRGYSECGAIPNIIDSSSARTLAGQNNLPAGAPIYRLARQLLTLQLLACLLVCEKNSPFGIVPPYLTDLPILHTRYPKIL